VAERSPRSVPHHASALEFADGVEVIEVDGPLPAEFAQLFSAAAELAAAK
jgi:hypothetical protein